MPIRKLIPRNAFDPDEVKVLTSAYDKAVALLYDRAPPAAVQEVIASKIIQLASRGERDPDRLCAATVIALRGDAATPKGS